MPIHKEVNHDFFKTWSPEMAYVLGYIAADGAITIGKRGNHYIDIISVDQELPEMVRKSFGSNHSITQVKRNSRWQTAYRIQIGSKEMVGDLSKLGFLPRKTKRLIFPPGIPSKYFRDFIRGYFDGDGNVHYAIFKRADCKLGYGQQLRVLFTSCSLNLLKVIDSSLVEAIEIQKGMLRKEKTYYRLNYYRRKDVEKIFHFFYDHKPALYLKRKFVYFKKALKKIRGPVAQPG